MTPVVCQFLAPDGVPISNAEVEIQLSEPTFDDQETGVVMPRLVTTVTDENGMATIELWPGPTAYVVSVEDPATPTSLSYKFYVPNLDVPGTTVRLQDLIVDDPMSDTTYDEAALLIIHDAKTNAIAAQISAQAASAAAIAAKEVSEGIALTVATTATELAGAAEAAVNAKNAAQTAQGVAEAAAALAVGKATEASTSAAAALVSRSAAEDAEAAADASETAAKASELAAKASEIAAATSQDEAWESKLAASASAAAALTSQNGADASEADALVHAQAAQGSATSAGLSSTAAAISESNALSYKNSAAVSEGHAYTAMETAVASKDIAVTKAAEAAASAQAAAASATGMEASVTAAAASAESAEDSEDTATTQANIAITKAEEAHNWAVVAQAAADGAVAGQLNSDWLSEAGVTKILNKPFIPSTKAHVGLGNVDNKSSATILSELSGAQVQTSLAGTLTLGKTVEPALVLSDTDAAVDAKRWTITIVNSDGSFSIGTQTDAGVTTPRFSIARTTAVKLMSGAFDVEAPNGSPGTSSRLGISGAMATNRTFDIQTANKKRWGIGANPDTENGTGIGSNFMITRHDDNGNLIDSVMTVNRFNSVTSFSGNVWANSGKLVLNSATAAARSMEFRTSGSMRWQWGVQASAEPGSSVGSDMQLYRYDDTGSVHATPAMVISRATGVVWVGATVTAQTFNITNAATTRNADTVFYSSTNDAVNKNTAVGLKTSLGLQNVDNTADVNKPISTATQTAINAKQASADKDTSGGYVGLTGYSINMKSVDGSVVSLINNENVAPRTYTFPDKSGVVALKSDLENLTTPPVMAPTTLKPGIHTIVNSHAVTIPDLTNPVQMTLLMAGNRIASPLITTIDGWNVNPGVHTILSPVLYGSKHGWWGTLVMTPPQLSSMVSPSTPPVSSATAATINIVNTLTLDNGNITVVLVQDRHAWANTTTNLRLYAINNTTKEITSIGYTTTSIASTYHANMGAYKIDETAFGLFIGVSAGPTQAQRYDLSGGVFTATSLQQVSSSLPIIPIIAAGGNKFLLWNTQGNLNYVTLGNPNASTSLLTKPGTVTTADNRLKYLGGDKFLAVIPNSAYGIDGGPYTMTGYIGTLTGSSMAWTAGTPVMTNALIVTRNDAGLIAENSLLWTMDTANGMYLYGCLESTTSGQSTGFRVITVTGTTIALGAQLSVNNAAMHQSAAVGHIYNRVRHQEDLLVEGMKGRRTRGLLMIDNSTILFSSLNIASSAYVSLIKRSGTTLSYTQVALGQTNTAALTADVSTNTKYFALHTTADGLTSRMFELDITGGMVNLVSTVVLPKLPTLVFSDVLSDVAMKFDSQWYSWTGMPSSALSFGTDQYLSFDAWPTINIYGNFSQ